MIQFSEDYNAQTIFDQVWEAPYSWFSTPSIDTTLPQIVYEVSWEDGFTSKKESEVLVTAEMIEEAVWKVFKEIVSEYENFAPTNFADWVSDLDANAVDMILQMAMFGEIRYS